MFCNILAIVGVALLAIAGLLASKQHRWLCAAQFTTGDVVEMIRSRGSKGGGTFAPRVEFTGRDGARHSFVRGYSSSPPDYAVGDKVPVAFDAKSSGRIVSFGERFGFPLVLGAVGLMMLTIAGGLIVGRHYVPRIYLERDSIALKL